MPIFFSNKNYRCHQYLNMSNFYPEEFFVAPSGIGSNVSAFTAERANDLKKQYQKVIEEKEKYLTFFINGNKITLNCEESNSDSNQDKAECKKEDNNKIFDENQEHLSPQATPQNQDLNEDENPKHKNKIFSATGKVISSHYRKFWEKNKQMIREMMGEKIQKQDSESIYNNILIKLKRISTKNRPYTQRACKSMFFPPRSDPKIKELFIFVNSRFVQYLKSGCLSNLHPEQLYQQLLEWLQNELIKEL